MILQKIKRAFGITLVGLMMSCSIGCGSLAGTSEGESSASESTVTREAVMDILIFGGQSNMQGQTELNPLDEPVADALEYRLLTDSLVPLLNPVGEDIDDHLLASHLGCGSLVPYFADEYVKGTNRKAVAVHVAKGATMMVDWLKDSAAGAARYAKTVEKINAAKAKVEADPENESGQIYYVWLQGESDAWAKTSKESYQTMLTQFKNDLRQDIGIDKFLIIEVGYFSSHYGGKNEQDEAIQAAQVELCETDPDFAYLTDWAKELSLNPEYLNPNAVGHFNNAGMKIIGRAAGKKAAEIALADLQK